MTIKITPIAWSLSLAASLLMATPALASNVLIQNNLPTGQFYMQCTPYPTRLQPLDSQQSLGGSASKVFFLGALKPTDQNVQTTCQLYFKAKEYQTGELKVINLGHLVFEFRDRQGQDFDMEITNALSTDFRGIHIEDNLGYINPEDGEEKHLTSKFFVHQAEIGSYTITLTRDRD